MVLKNLKNKIKRIPIRLLFLILLIIGLLPFWGIYKYFSNEIKISNLISLGKYSFFILIGVYGIVLFDLIKNLYKNKDDKYFGGKIFFLIALWIIIAQLSD